MGPPLDPQEHPKSIKINVNLKVRLCVGVGMCFLCPRCRQGSDGYAQTTVNTMVLEAFHVLEFLCFLVYGIILGVIFVDFGGPWTTFW